MKIGEAILRRNELTETLEQLTTRVKNNLIVQEGDSPGECPRVILSKLAKEEEALERLIRQIYYTNSHTMCGSRTLSDALLHKKILTMKARSYVKFTKNFTNSSAGKLKDKGVTNDAIKNTLSQLTKGNENAPEEGMKALEQEMKFLNDVRELQKLEETSKKLNEELEALDLQIKTVTWASDIIEDDVSVIVASE